MTQNIASLPKLGIVPDALGKLYRRWNGVGTMLRSAWSTVRMQSEIRPAENAITLGILRSDFGFSVLSLVLITFQSHAQGMWQKGHRCEERAAIFLQPLVL